MFKEIIEYIVKHDSLISQTIAMIATDLSVLFLSQKKPKNAVFLWLVSQPFRFMNLSELKILQANQILLTLNWSRWFFNYYIRYSKLYRSIIWNIFKKIYINNYRLTTINKEKMKWFLKEHKKYDVVLYDNYWDVPYIKQKTIYEPISLNFWNNEIFYCDARNLIDVLKKIPQNITYLKFSNDLYEYSHFNRDFFVWVIKHLPRNLKEFDLERYNEWFDDLLIDISFLKEIIVNLPPTLKDFSFGYIDIFKIKWDIDKWNEEWFYDINELVILINCFTNSLEKLTINNWLLEQNYKEEDILYFLSSLPSHLKYINLWLLSFADIIPELRDFYNSLDEDGEEIYNVNELKEFVRKYKNKKSS